MRMRNLLALSVVLLLSVGLTTAAAAKKQPFAASQLLCGNAHGMFSTKASSNFYGASYKGQRVLWTCDSYSDSSAAQPMGQSCVNDGGKSARIDAPGFVTCWKN